MGVKIEFFHRRSSVLPVLSWLPSYKAANLKWDLLAGMTLSFYVIPVSMAYASLAGLPPQTGIYCYLFAGLLYFLFGSSRQLAIGPTSAMAMVIGTSIAAMANGDPANAILLASGTALLVAFLFLVAWLIRLSSLVNFISDTILTGFKAGAALVIASTQLPKLFGLHITASNFFERIWLILSGLGETHLPTLIFGLVALVLLVAGQRFLPGKPVSLVVVVLAILSVYYGTDNTASLAMVGELPGGIPSLSVPLMKFREVDGIFTLAMACFLLSYVESISAARTLAAKNGYEVNARQELLALGAGNLASALGGGFPVAGGLSQSSVNDKSGAKSLISLVITSILLGLCLLFLTGLFRYLPEVILAVIVLDAIAGLIRIQEMKHLFKVSRLEFWISLSTIIAVLFFGVLNGVLIAVVLSLIFLLKQAASPHIAILGQIPGTTNYSDMQRHPDNIPVKEVLILRVEASILYFNINNINDRIHQIVNDYPGHLRMVIMDLSSANYVDVAGARFFLHLEDDLEKKGIGMYIVDALGQVRDILRAEGMEKEIGHISRKVTIHNVVTATAQHRGMAPQP
jgi:high affinity sulfate transporter 1